MVERKGRVRAWGVPHISAKTLLPSLMQSINKDATVYTDGSLVYKHIHEYFMTHASVSHHVQEYARGSVHTNNRGFLAVPKRTISGTYTHVNPRHLDRYLAEQVSASTSGMRNTDRVLSRPPKRRRQGLTYKILSRVIRVSAPYWDPQLA